jgi:hypothetical protein
MGAALAVVLEILVEENSKHASLGQQNSFGPTF